jgi:hypothetical protein
MKTIVHPRAVEYAEGVVRDLERRIAQLRQVAAQPEAEAFAPDVLELAARLARAVAGVARALPDRERRTTGGRCG